MRKALVALAAGIGLSASVSWHGAAAAPQIALDVSPATVVQGQTLLVRVRGAPLAVRITAGGRAVLAYRAPGGYRAFVGTSPVTPSGPLVVQAVVETAGRTLTLAGRAQVRAGSFGVRRLRVPPELLDPALVAEERRRVAAAVAAPLAEPLWRGPFRLPVDGPLTSNYGVRSVYNDVPRGYHLGVDFRADEGVPVHAPQTGVVTLAEALPLSGNAIFLDHGAGVFTSYLHLSAIAVRPGARVRPGDLIGRVGSTGLSTGPHLHWGMRVHGVLVNPLYWTTEGPLTAR